MIVISGMLGVLIVLDWRLGVGMIVYLGVSLLLVLSMRHRAVRESSDEMGTYAKLYGGIEERLTAVEDLRANGAENHAMWRFVEDSSEAIYQRRAHGRRRSCGCGGRCRSMSPSDSSARWCCRPPSSAMGRSRWVPRSCCSSTCT